MPGPRRHRPDPETDVVRAGEREPAATAPIAGSQQSESGVARVLWMQSAVGNAAVSRMLAREPATAEPAAAESDTAKTPRPAAARPKDNVLTNTAASKTGTVSNAYGTFTYSVIKNAGSNGCDFSLSFVAFSPEVSSTKITFIQTIKGHKDAGKPFYLNNDSTYYAPFSPGGSGLYTDHLKTETDPFYNFEDKTSTDESTGTTAPTTTTMTDGPRIGSIAGERGQTFETAAFALSGTDKGEFFGTLTWGWDIDGAGTFALQNVATHDDISTDFGAALRQFIARQSDITKTATTPAPANLDTLPSDKCRELNAAELKILQPIGDYAKIKPDTRVWVVGRYSDPGDKLGAKVNADAVQSELVRMGVPLDHIRVTYLEQTGVTKRTAPVEITVIES